MNHISFTEYLNFKQKIQTKRRKYIKAMTYWKNPELRGHRQLMNGSVEWQQELHLLPGIKPLRNGPWLHCYLKPARQQPLWPHLWDSAHPCWMCVAVNGWGIPEWGQIEGVHLFLFLIFLKWIKDMYCAPVHTHTGCLVFKHKKYNETCRLGQKHLNNITGMDIPFQP